MHPSSETGCNSRDISTIVSRGAVLRTVTTRSLSGDQVTETSVSPSKSSVTIHPDEPLMSAGSTRSAKVATSKSGDVEDDVWTLTREPMACSRNAAPSNRKVWS